LPLFPAVSQNSGAAQPCVAVHVRHTPVPEEVSQTSPLAHVGEQVGCGVGLFLSSQEFEMH
jgi:hypothetical protein